MAKKQRKLSKFDKVKLVACAGLKTIFKVPKSTLHAANGKNDKKDIAQIVKKKKC